MKRKITFLFWMWRGGISEYMMIAMFCLTHTLYFLTRLNKPQIHDCYI